ncbi:MAG: signal peptidase II [Alphaproteobacteria bacterium]|nr:signal peptidase II [Alphaproteobacteria bacterium]
MTLISRMRFLGLLVAALSFFADQLLKWYLLGPFGLMERGRFRITFFFDLLPIFNQGVSYGLFPQEGMGRWVLFCIAVVLLLGLFYLLLNVYDSFCAIGLGLIIGGGIGNAFDRWFYGAVFDFIFLHIGDFRWFVFNLADCSIMLGIGLVSCYFVFRSSEGGTIFGAKNVDDCPFRAVEEDISVVTTSLGPEISGDDDVCKS